MKNSSGSMHRARRFTAVSAFCSCCPTDSTVSRLGIAATRKFGGSVARNRAKRLIRDVFRRNKIAPGFDVVVVPKRALLETSLSAFEAEFRRTLERRVASMIRPVTRSNPESLLARSWRCSASINSFFRRISLDPAAFCQAAPTTPARRSSGTGRCGEAGWRPGAWPAATRSARPGTIRSR